MHKCFIESKCWLSYLLTGQNYNRSIVAVDSSISSGFTAGTTTGEAEEASVFAGSDGLLSVDKSGRWQSFCF